MTESKLHDTHQVESAITAACSKIAPVWPLDSYVAVNPYLGMADQSFATVAERMSKVAGAKSTLPLGAYLEAFARGDIQQSDLAVALQEAGLDSEAGEYLAHSQQLAAEEQMATETRLVPTVADVAAKLTGTNWSRIVVERIGAWAAAYHDRGQALWQPAREASLYATWQQEASIDLTPELLGASTFRKVVARLPATAHEAAVAAVTQLGVRDDSLELYLHRLLMRVGGWSSYAARSVWEAQLAGEEDDTLEQFLCVLLAWELALLDSLGPELRAAWAGAQDELNQLSRDLAVAPTLQTQLIWQRASEVAAQRTLVHSFDAAAEGACSSVAAAGRPVAQAVFCIDVRSEAFRRHLEAASPAVHTLGFAGFFAFPIEFVPLGHEHGGAHCPVLLRPAHTVHECIADEGAELAALERRQLGHQVGRAWNAFKMGAVSCFSFVGPVGLAYLPKLFTDAFGLTRPVAHPSEEGLGAHAHRRDVRLHAATDPTSGISLAARIELAGGALTAMSLTEGFARLVLIAGHGSSTVNNPHATGLDCGACGGRTGEANARVAAAVLNQVEVREALIERGILIPEDTFFLAGLHDTTTDELRLYNRDQVPAALAADLAELESALAVAGRSCRAERSSRLHLGAGAAVDAALLSRARDWAQTRPEWGLAGCSSFVVAPRQRSAALDLGGRAFLHSYDWKKDSDFGVLELIMTAPMVVTSWISLQYYASTVEGEVFGAGNKVLHNVVGQIGVLEGNGGDLRVGLPKQSVHDGEGFQHEAHRLNVVIEAPREAMNAIIAKHESVRNLLDNGWLHLFAMDEAGRISHRYAGGLRWLPVQQALSPECEALPMASGMN